MMISVGNIGVVGAAARSKGGGGWVIRDENGNTALYQHDIANSKWWYNGQSYASEAALLTAVGGVLAAGAYTFGPNTVGVDRITNGGFASDTSWTKYGTAAISGGVASLPASGDKIEQGFVTEARKSYRVRSTIGGFSSFCGVWDNANTSGVLSNTTAGRGPGTVDMFFRANDGTSFPLWFGNAGGTVTLDNVSAFEVQSIPGVSDAVSVALKALTGPTNAAEEVLWSTDLNNLTNRVKLTRNTSKELRLIVTQANTEVANLLLGTVENSTPISVAFAVANDDVWGLLHGGSAQSDSSAAWPGSAYMRWGRDSAGNAWGGSLYGMAVFNRRVSNDRLTAIAASL